MLQLFPVGVAENLKTYVYRLIDPRNGETFYVGKGKGNRVFEHSRATIKTDDPTSDKLTRIREIHVGGFEVAHVIHRHGMDNKTAIEVEAALIDAYPGLTNVITGAGSSEFGTMHALEAIDKYQAKVANLKHRAILINVNRSATMDSLYEATRYAWKIKISKAQRAEFVIAVSQGVIREVFVAEKWMPAKPKYFPGRDEKPNRYGFEGRIAPTRIRSLYVRKRIPDQYRKKGAANPIKYTYS